MQRTNQLLPSKTKKHKPDAGVDYQAFLQAIIESPADKHTPALTKYVADYGSPAFLKRANTCNIPFHYHARDFPMFTSLLGHACLNLDLEFIVSLMLLGVDLENGAEAQGVAEARYSPLILACMVDRVELVKLLLDLGSNILNEMYEGCRTCLLAINKTETCDVLLNHARKLNILPRFVTISVITRLIAKHSYIIADHLIGLDDLDNAVNLHYLAISLATLAYVPADYNLNALQYLLHITMKYNPMPIPKLVNKNMTFSIAESHLSLFGTELPINKKLSRKQVLLKANAQIHTLLCDTQACAPYLKHIENELLRYFEHCHPQDQFPTIDRNEIDTLIIDGLALPIPKAKSNYFTHAKAFPNKKSALKELLILMMRKHGLANEIVKWIGFIDHVVANQAVKRGDFVIESNAAGVTIIHGSLSHMLQTVIVLLAIEKNVIDINYYHGKHKRKLSAQALLATLVTQDVSNGASLWMITRDQRMPTYKTFIDPHKLQSMIMCESRSLGLRALSDYVTLSFCKALVKFHDTLKIFNPALTDFNIFMEVLSTLPTSTVYHMDDIVNQAVAKYEKQTREKTKEYVVSKMGRFATAQVKHYQPDTSFELNKISNKRVKI